MVAGDWNVLHPAQRQAEQIVTRIRCARWPTHVAMAPSRYAFLHPGVRQTDAAPRPGSAAAHAAAAYGPSAEAGRDGVVSAYLADAVTPEAFVYVKPPGLKETARNFATWQVVEQRALRVNRLFFQGGARALPGPREGGGMRKEVEPNGWEEVMEEAVSLSEEAGSGPRSLLHPMFVTSVIFRAEVYWGLGTDPILRALDVLEVVFVPKASSGSGHTTNPGGGSSAKTEYSKFLTYFDGPLGTVEIRFDYGFVYSAAQRIFALSNQLSKAYQSNSVWKYAASWLPLIRKVRSRLEHTVFVAERYWHPGKVLRFRRKYFPLSNARPLLDPIDDAARAFVSRLGTGGTKDEHTAGWREAYAIWRAERIRRENFILGEAVFSQEQTSHDGSAATTKLGKNHDDETQTRFFPLRPTVNYLPAATSRKQEFSEDDYKAEQLLGATLNSWDLWTAPVDFQLLGSRLVAYAEDGKDAVLARIFDNLGVSDRFFVEIGVGDGQECNSRYWRAIRGWDGVMLDILTETPDFLTLGLLTEENVVKEVERVVRNYGGNTDHDERTTRNNAVSDEVLRTKKFDLLSIDVDGLDWHFLRQLLLAGYRPRVVVVEYAKAHAPRALVWKKSLSRVATESESSSSSLRKDSDPRAKTRESGWSALSHPREPFSPGGSAETLVRLANAFGYDLVYVCEVDLIFVLRGANTDEKIVDALVSHRGNFSPALWKVGVSVESEAPEQHGGFSSDRSASSVGAPVEAGGIKTVTPPPDGNEVDSGKNKEGGSPFRPSPKTQITIGFDTDPPNAMVTDSGWVSLSMPSML